MCTAPRRELILWGLRVPKQFPFSLHFRLRFWRRFWFPKWLKMEFKMGSPKSLKSPLEALGMVPGRSWSEKRGSLKWFPKWIPKKTTSEQNHSKTARTGVNEESAEGGCRAQVAPTRLARGWLKIINRCLSKERMNANVFSRAMGRGANQSSVRLGSPLFSSLGAMGRRPGEFAKPIGFLQFWWFILRTQCFCCTNLVVFISSTTRLETLRKF